MSYRKEDQERAAQLSKGQKQLEQRNEAIDVLVRDLQDEKLNNLREIFRLVEEQNAMWRD